MWGAGLGNTYGHIAIATGEGDTHQFYSYDLNWGQKVVAVSDDIREYLINKELG